MTIDELMALPRLQWTDEQVREVAMKIASDALSGIPPDDQSRYEAGLRRGYYLGVEGALNIIRYGT